MSQLIFRRVALLLITLLFWSRRIWSSEDSSFSSGLGLPTLLVGSYTPHQASS